MVASSSGAGCSRTKVGSRVQPVIHRPEFCPQIGDRAFRDVGAGTTVGACSMSLPTSCCRAAVWVVPVRGGHSATAAGRRWPTRVYTGPTPIRRACRCWPSPRRTPGRPALPCWPTRSDPGETSPACWGRPWPRRSARPCVVGSALRRSYVWCRCRQGGRWPAGGEASTSTGWPRWRPGSCTATASGRAWCRSSVSDEDARTLRG